MGLILAEYALFSLDLAYSVWIWLIQLGHALSGLDTPYSVWIWLI
jgi:hypothetical protein